MQARWRVRDLIDLEFFFSQSSDEMQNAGFSDESTFERRLYQSYEQSHKPPFSRRDLIKYWLDENRKIYGKTAGKKARLPGAVYREAFSLLRNMVIIASVVSGAGIAWSVLSYSGTAPINIFTCIWVLIFPQLILLILMGVSVIFSGLGVPGALKGVYPVISSLIRRWIMRTKISGEKALSADQRNQLYALTGLIGRRQTLYGTVFFWPVFNLSQVFGVFFNVGMIGATLVKLAITDLAFGWQSTLLPDPETVYHMVKVFSIPWSWISSAHPTIAQIEGSRMILKDGMLNLATLDLVSWWPFLCFTMIFYGLAPRLVLLAAGLWQQNRALRRINFSTGACDRLIHRMHAPHVKSTGRNYFSSHAAAIVTQTDKDSVTPKAETVISFDPAIVFVPEDISGQFKGGDLKERIAQILSLRMIGRIPCNMDPEKDMAALEAALSRAGISMHDIRMVMLTEAWQPPIREVLSWLRWLRSKAENDTGMIVALVGKPVNQMVFTSPDNTDRMIWEQAISGLGDPFIRVENMGGC